MRQAQWLVFDEYVVANANPVATTNQDFNSKLGTYDQLALQAVVDNVTLSPTTLKVQIMHSADGRVWMAKTAPGGVGPGPAEINTGGAVLSAGQTSYFGSDPAVVAGVMNQIPTLAFVQLAVSLAGTGGAHVRVYVTARDWGGR